MVAATIRSKSEVKASYPSAVGDHVLSFTPPDRRDLQLSGLMIHPQSQMFWCATCPGLSDCLVA